ncbi:MAG TPA: TadE/TadG family type IV pilus assembly protein [Candidatus Margulisiibacteriota bacterium]|nr:TadE/TadG family type IV pilus assembly protein [Candidatus Margulisiibacteriota bacterium]
MTASRLLRALPFRDRRGVAAVEFALFSVVFLVILAGTVDIGNLIFSTYQLDATVSAGAQYAVVNATSVSSTNGATLASSISAVVNNGHGTGGGWSNTVVVNNGPTTTTSDGSPSSSGTALNADRCYCPTGSPGSWSWGSSQICGAGCGGGGIAGKFVSITATRTFTPFFPAWGILSGNTLTRTAMVQVE